MSIRANTLITLKEILDEKEIEVNIPELDVQNIIKTEEQAYARMCLLFAMHTLTLDDVIISKVISDLSSFGVYAFAEDEDKVFFEKPRELLTRQDICRLGNKENSVYTLAWCLRLTPKLSFLRGKYRINTGILEAILPKLPFFELIKEIRLRPAGEILGAFDLHLCLYWLALQGERYQKKIKLKRSTLQETIHAFKWLFSKSDWNAINIFELFEKQQRHNISGFGYKMNKDSELLKLDKIIIKAENINELKRLASFLDESAYIMGQYPDIEHMHLCDFLRDNHADADFVVVRK